jgi:hypothetical protein
MHKLRGGGSLLGGGRTFVALLVLLAASAPTVACVPRETDAGRADALPIGRPIFKEYKGANVYLLRRDDGSVVALWGVSPLAPAEGSRVQCFVQDRAGRAFRGEERPYVDPCRGAWWSREGEFLGYSGDPADAPSAGPPLVRIPAEVRAGRVYLDETVLRCLQSRRGDCGQ